MPLKNGHLTAQETAFAKALAETGDTMHAARLAGVKHPTVNASRMAKREGVQRAVLDIQAGVLVNDLLPVALTTLRSVMTDDRAPYNAKVAAAKVVVDRSFKFAEDKPADEPHTWDAAQLAQRIEELKRLRDELARPTLELEANHPEGGIFD
jgi:hypothetical protein